MDTRLFWLLVSLLLLLTFLTVFASYASMTARWLVLKRWLLRSLVIVSLSIVAGIPLWHILVVGIVTGKFHGKIKLSKGEVVTIKENLLTDLVTFQLTVPRTSLRLTDLTDSMIKSTSEDRFLQDLEVAIYIGRHRYYDFYPMLFPYRVEKSSSYLTYSLSPDKQIKVWDVKQIRPSNVNEPVLLLEYESDIESDDSTAFNNEVQEIWKDVKSFVDRIPMKQVDIRVRGSSQTGLPGEADKAYIFRYLKNEDGTWRVVKQYSGT